MTEKHYSITDFFEALRNRQIPLYSDLVKTLPELINKVVNVDEVQFFYGKNIYLEGEKLLYFFLPNKIVQVRIFKREVEFRTLKHEVKEVIYTPEFYDAPAAMSVVFSNGQTLEFNSLEDSNSDWSSTYADIILEIYKSY
jgi:Protein of unknown function (DUF3908)